MFEVTTMKISKSTIYIVQESVELRKRKTTYHYVDQRIALIKKNFKRYRINKGKAKKKTILRSPMS